MSKQVSKDDKEIKDVKTEAPKKDESPFFTNPNGALMAAVTWAGIASVGGFFYGLLRSKTIEKGLPTLKRLPAVKTALVTLHPRLSSAFVRLLQYRDYSKASKDAYDHAIAYTEKLLLSCTFVRNRCQEHKPVDSHWHVALCETHLWQIRKHLHCLQSSLPADIKHQGDLYSLHFRATEIITEILKQVQHERTLMEVFCTSLILKQDYPI
jgi:hypothetical protein